MSAGTEAACDGAISYYSLEILKANGTVVRIFPVHHTFEVN